MSKTKRIRFAIYTRYSSEMQNDLSLEAQETRCRQAIAERGGVVVSVFSDGAKSGWSLERDGFNELRQHAEKGKFDAVMFWKFDRLARNHEHVVMIKMLLRHEYGLKLYCVEGFSEDEDASPYTAMMEQMLAVFSAFYSKNLSSETKRGKRQRAMKGEFNGSVAPLGYDLITVATSSPERPAGLYVNPTVAPVIVEAFGMYTTGKQSDNDIAKWLDNHPIIQAVRVGQKPVSKDLTRDLLQNRVYTGRVCHSDTQYAGSLGEMKKSSRGRKEWFEGKHDGIIPDELFETCLEVRKNLEARRASPTQSQFYLLKDKLYCASCMANRPDGIKDHKYGRMRGSYDNQRKKTLYRCSSKLRGYTGCERSYVEAVRIEQQVIDLLMSLKPSENFEKRVESLLKQQSNHQQAYLRIDELQQVIKRIDVSWENGFLEQDEYLSRHRQLTQEIESLRPVQMDDVMEYADILKNFSAYWEGCLEVDDPNEARYQLIEKVVERVYVDGDTIKGLVLKGEYKLFLDTLDGIKKAPEYTNAFLTSTFGSDGREILTCYYYNGW